MSGVILGEGVTRETKVYRIVPFNRFVELFENKKNALVRPKLWEDPFENLALNSPIDVMGEMGTIPFKDDVYGQCWSLNTASDAMWRIYSQGTDGIRIRSKVGKLIDGLAATDKLPELTCFIGKVNYLSDDELKTFAKNQFSGGFDSDGKKIAETLLIKRKAFKHEREVRLIYSAVGGTLPEKNLHFYDFDPHQVIDQIMLHPQLPEYEAKWLKKSILANTGWKHDLKQSMMYRPPQGFVFKVTP